MSKRNKRAVTERRRTVPERIVFGVAFVVLVVWTVITLYMFFWAGTSALKTNLDYIREPLMLPKIDELQWGNFKVAIGKLQHNGVGFLGMTFNSIWFAVGCPLITSFMVCVVGYVMAQYDFKGKNFLLGLIIFKMVIPIYGSLPATYKLIYDLGLNDSIAFLVTAITGINGSTLITYGFFRGVPRAYREAVYMDGGSDLRAFLTVGLPMGKSIYLVYFLLGFIEHWNNYDTPILYLDSMPTLASGLYYFQQEIIYEANNPAYFAGALMTMLPVLILFIFFSDKIMGKLYIGGLKE